MASSLLKVTHPDGGTALTRLGPPNTISLSQPCFPAPLLEQKNALHPEPSHTPGSVQWVAVGGTPQC